MSTTYEKAIRLHDKPKLPPDLTTAVQSLDTYLAQNLIENHKHARIRLRVERAKHTRINHALEADARKIKVEPSTDSESVRPIQKITGPGTAQQQTKKWKCKKVETEKKKVIACKPQEEPTEGSLIVEQVKGIWCVCNNCGHRFVHHSKSLSSQYFCTWGKCQANIRLKHYK